MLSVQSKRKEKARVAARARRSQEASIIMELAHELLISREKVRRIDKATIVKFAIEYIKAYEILCRYCAGCSSAASCFGPATGAGAPGATTCCAGGQRANFAARVRELAPYPLRAQAGCPEGAASATGTRSRLHAAVQHTNSSNTATTSPNSHLINTATFAGDAAARAAGPVAAPRAPPPEPAPAPVQPAPMEPMRAGHATTPPAVTTSVISTNSIFAPRTDDMDSHFLIIKERNGKSAFVFKPDSEVLDEDDLTHLAPQAGDACISLEVDPLDEIELDKTGPFALAATPAAQPRAHAQADFRPAAGGKARSSGPLMTAERHELMLESAWFGAQ